MILSKWLIAGNYYIVQLENCYALGKFKGKRRRKNGKEEDCFIFICYNYNVESCLRRYVEECEVEAGAQAGEGTAREMMDILLASREKTASVIATALREWENRT